MAKKYRVKYAFGTPAMYEALKQAHNLDEYTVYFIAEENSEYGTFYKGEVRVGTAKASDLVFDKKETIVLAQASDPGEEDATIEIAAGTSLVKVINDVYKWAFNNLDNVQEQINTLTADGGAGSIADAIANALDAASGSLFYSPEYIDANFLTNDDLGSIQELINVFKDPDTGQIDEGVIETIVSAAEGIEAVVSNYYTKEETEALLVSADKNIVKTYDSSANFPGPEDANKNVFYVDDEENTVYRWGWNEEGDAREYVEISGSGSGPSSDVKLETGIYLKGGKTTVSVAKGSSLTVEYVFSSANTMTQYNKKTHQFEKIQQQTGTIGTVKYLLDGIQFDSGNIKQSNYNETDDSKNTYNKFTVPASRFTASTHELKIVASDNAGNTATEIVTVNIISASITSSYVVVPTNLQTNINIPVTVTSTSDAELFYTIDDEEPIKVQDVPVGSPVIVISISPEGREHGYHTIKAWATVYIEESDTTISTKTLSYDVIWYDPSNPLPIITTAFSVPESEEGGYEITQYEYATLTYQVYPASTVDLIIHEIGSGIQRIVNTLNVDTIAKSWTYTFDTVGEYEIFINVHYGESSILASDKYLVNVKKSEISMDATPGSVLYFTAKNRSNEEANPAQWHSEIGNVDAVLEGFLWNGNSGWHSEGATTSLRVASGAKCTIPYQPFGGVDKIETGQVFEIDFSTSNLSDSTAEVVKCYSETDKSGIIITATGAYFSSTDFNQSADGDARIFVPFKENERVRLSFVITPWESDEEGHGPNDPEAKINLWNGTQYTEFNSITEGWWRFVKIYINGICVGIHNYQSSFHQSNPSSIIIGSDKATIDVYSIRCYDTVLYDRAIVNNFVADTQDPVEKLRLFKRNNILNEAGTDVEPSALRRLMPCLFVTCQTDADVSGIVNNEHILPTNKADKRGVTIFFDCDGLDDDVKEYYNFCHTFVAFNVQWAVQGTSSQYYPRRNWKGTLKTEKKFKEDYITTATGSKPTYVFVDVPWEESIKDGRDARAVYVNKYKDKYTNKYQLKDFSAISDDKRTVDQISSIPAKKFCMKADFAESSGTHNTGFAKYVDVILKSLGYDYLTPPQKAQYNKTRRMTDVTFRTSVDGYPIAMFWRPTFEDDWEFYGKFNFNLDKGAESVFGFIDVKDGGLTDADINPMTGQPFVQFDEDYYDEASQEDRILYECPVECWEFTNNSTDLCKFRNVTPTSFTEKSKDADGVTEIPAWLGSFEARHPDNDNLIELDYGTGLKKPEHWASFSEWVSSTDRTGVHNYDKNLPVPTSWTGTYDELIAGASEKEVFGIYTGKLSNGTLIPSHGEPIEVDLDRRYILQPEVQDEGDGTWSPDIAYDLYGHIVHYNSVDSEWYDDTRDADIWVDDGEYHEEESAVDYNKTYYIANSSDAQFGKVYKYNTSTSAWDNIANISAYALPSPVTYNMVTYQYDTAEYRFAKFKAELPLHMNIPMTTAYYVLTEFFCCADQRAKNMMFASWGYEPGASKVKPANAFPSEEAADAAGYKPVYKYEIGTVAAAATPSVYAASAPTRGLVLGAAPATVCINEIDATNKKMEFYNPTASAITLTGYTLKGVDDKDAARDNWSFPLGATIDAGGYYVITFKSAADHPELGPAYGLSPTKKWSFTLEDGTGTTIDTVSKAADVDITNKSLGRETDGAETWVQFDVPTIGSANESGEEPGVPTTELLSHLSYTTTAEELSGLCFNADKTTLFGVSDRGKLYSIALDGTTTEIVIAALADEDLEGITIDSNGDLYAINERTGQVWKIEGPDYDTASAAFIVTPVGDNPSSNGFEGIAAFGNQFIVGNQKNPTALYTISSLGGSPILLAELDCVTEIADVAYDGTNIWVLDSTEATLAKLAADGTLVEKFSMPFISTSDNGPEGLAIDGDIAFVGCDNANMDLFKVSLTNDPLTTTVVMNEFDPDYKLFELYNTTSTAINLAGYTMTKDNDETTKFVFGNITIPSHGFVVLPFKSDGTAGPTFGCSADKGFEYKLFDTEGNVVDRVDNITDKVVIPEGCTLGRVFDGANEFVLFKHHGTIGKTNNNGVLNSGIFINEVDTNGNSIGKRFEIYNSTSSAYDLTGHKFVKDGSEWSVVGTAVGEGKGLPTITVPANGYLVVQCNNTKSKDATAESPAKDATQWPDFGFSGSKGFVLEIKNADGSYIDRVNNLMDGVVNPNGQVPSGTQTWGRASDGEEHNYVLFDTPNLGSSNTGGTRYTATPAVDASTLFINEIDCTNDQIELYNPYDVAMDIEGYILSKDGDSLSMWTIPAGYEIPANGFLTINCKQWNPALGPSFGLSATNGFYLTLADPTGLVLDVVNNRTDSENYIAPQSGHTLGRVEDGGSEWTEFSPGSIGTTNAEGTPYVPVPVDPGTPITDHVVINEVAYRKIELYNPTSAAVNISGLWLVKSPQDPGYNENVATEGRYDAWQIPSGTTIAAGGFVAYETQNSAVPGPQFGLSFKSGKSFDLYLMQNIGDMATAVGAQTIDQSKVIDHIDNYTSPVVDDNNAISIGRVKDGYSNICKFATPTIGSTNNNSTPIPIDGGDVPTPGTIKTVLYWVPIDAEYIWYPIFYDNDTILSLDNTGHIKFNPNVESTDRVGTGYAYNGTESVLWLNFKDAYDAEIRATYVTMRSKGGLTYANCMKYFNQGQSDQWPENVYNMDGKFKYVIPATKGYTDYSTQDPNTGKYGVNIRNSSYLYECQGSREEHRKWWLNNRFTYMDSRYFAVSYAEDYATIRLYTPSIWEGVTPSSTFKLTPYADMYLRVMFGQIVSTLRAEKNKTYDIIPSDPDLRFNDTETIIYGASNILSFGDMTNKYAGSVAIDKASKITDIQLGANAPYYNENITGAGLTIGAGNTTLKNIDLRGCTKLTSIAGLKQITSIEKIYAQRTGITSFDFSKDGINLNEIYYPNTVANITFVNANNIAYDKMDIPTFANIKTVWIENCAKLREDSWKLINSILSTPNNLLAAVRVAGFAWTINTKTAFDNWTKMLELMGISASGVQAYDRPYLSGTVNIGGEVRVSAGYKAGIEARFADYGGLKLNIPAANIVDMQGIKIKYPKNVTYLNNVATIIPGTEYRFDISYLPDDYVLAADKGVTWTVSGSEINKISIVEQTSEYIVLKYVGSTDGTSVYTLRAVSMSDSTKIDELILNPSATLTNIVITDLNGVEIDPSVTITINESETKTFNVKFLPLGTTDDQINTPRIIGGDYVAVSYDANIKQLAITGKDVASTSYVNVIIESSTVPNKNASLAFNVRNVASRIIYLKDANNQLIPGYALVKWTDPATLESRSTTVNAPSGIITLRTDEEWGYEKLEVDVDATAGATAPYNKPDAVICPKLAEGVTEDQYYTVNFYEPITVTFNIINGGRAIDDKPIRIRSNENSTIRGLDTSSPVPYNNVIGGSATSGAPIVMKLLPNTLHHITIEEVDGAGSPVTTNPTYTSWTGTIRTGIADVIYPNISLSRNYLTDVKDDTEIKMTVRTGSGNYKVVRLYVSTVGEITIKWGDGKPDLVVSAANGYNVSGTVNEIFHAYDANNEEYDITVSSDTANVNWFHVLAPGKSEMLPCVGTSLSSAGFHTVWSSEDIGAGLVAYQSTGAARFNYQYGVDSQNNPQIATHPTFKFNSKTYSQLVCVGNIYKSCTAMTSADSLFENTTLQQISPIPLFRNCVNIKSFNKTFKNSDITAIPANFFMNNDAASSFEETFASCSSLSSINSEAEIPFFSTTSAIEIRNLKNMFKDCILLTSEVPAFWKTFYGCSFCTFTDQNTFDGCYNISNIEDVPTEWGGPAETYHDLEQVKILDYVSFVDDGIETRGNTYITTDIYPKSHYSYVFEFSLYQQFYEPIPLFSAGFTTDESTLSEEYLDSAVDFIHNGYASGEQEQGKYTGYFLYRLGTDAGVDWSLATNIDGTPAYVFRPGYGGNERSTYPRGDDDWPGVGAQRIKVDISYSTDGYVGVYPYDDESAMMQYPLPNWQSADPDWTANLPIRFLLPYNNKPIYYPAPTDLDKFGHAKYIAIHELKVYDDTYDKNLVADLVPAYGNYEGNWTVFLYDKVGSHKMYPFTISPEGLSKVHFYSKK